MSLSRQQQIHHILSQHLQPLHIQVENESNRHHVPTGSETHFKVILASKQFEKLNRVARHRLVYELLSKEFSSGLHALSLHLFTPEEWDTKKNEVLKSPPCRNGMHHD